MKFSIAKSIKIARETFAHLNNDGLATSVGDIWSIKKILLLDYYMPAFINIMRSPRNNFNEYYFADPFCGSGLFTDFKDTELKDEFVAGSALIGALNASKLRYTGCIFSEKDQKNISALNSRLNKSKEKLNDQIYTAQTLEFKDAVEEILKIKKYQVAILVLIDPAGYVPIKWNLMEKLIKKVGVDIIFNFYTHRIAQNVSATKTKPEHEKSLNEFFGDEGWKQIRDIRKNSNILGAKLLDYYLEKIKRIPEKKTIDIGVYEQGDKKLYDLIFITRSVGGKKVMDGAKKVMRDTTTEAIRREFKAQLGAQSRLADHGF